MDAKQIELFYVRSTKNTHLYQVEQKQGDEPTTSIYLQKDSVGYQPPSEAIVLTIQFSAT